MIQYHFAAGDSASLRYATVAAGSRLPWRSVGLPGGLNGRQVADAARIARPDLKVIFVTGYAENAVVGNGILSPGMAIVTKPFVMEDLAQKIQAMIES